MAGRIGRFVRCFAEQCPDGASGCVATEQRNSVRRPHRRIGRARRRSAKKSLWIPSLFRAGRLRPLFRWRLCRSCLKGPGSLRGRALWRSRHGGAATRWLLRPAATACRARWFRTIRTEIRRQRDSAATRCSEYRTQTADSIRRESRPKPWQRLARLVRPLVVRCRRRVLCRGIRGIRRWL